MPSLGSEIRGHSLTPTHAESLGVPARGITYISHVSFHRTAKGYVVVWTSALNKKPFWFPRFATARTSSLMETEAIQRARHNHRDSQQSDAMGGLRIWNGTEERGLWRCTCTSSQRVCLAVRQQATLRPGPSWFEKHDTGDVLL